MEKYEIYEWKSLVFFVGHKIWKTTEILVVPMKLNGNRWEEPYNSIHWNIPKRIKATHWQWTEKTLWHWIKT